MKKLLLSLFISASFCAVSQVTPYKPYYNLGEPWQFQRFNYYGGNDPKIQDSLIELHKIKAKSTYVINKKGEKELSSKKLYNGNKSSYEVYNLNKRKFNYRSFYKTNNYRVYEWKTWGKTQKQINEYITIDTTEYLVEKTYSRKNKTSGTTRYFWNEKGWLDSLHYYSKKSMKPTLVTHYSYKNEKLAETRSYKKGKLTEVRKYDCTPLGKVEKKVAQTSQCINTEFDTDGNKIVITETTDEKGRIKKFKRTYVGDSKTIFRSESYDYKNRLTYRFETTATKESNINYRKGKEIYKSIRYFDKNKNQIKYEHYNKGKLHNRQSYTYDSEGRILSKTGTDKKGKEYSQTTYEYNQKGLVTKQTTQWKKKKSTEVYEYK